MSQPPRPGRPRPDHDEEPDRAQREQQERAQHELEQREQRERDERADRERERAARRTDVAERPKSGQKMDGKPRRIYVVWADVAHNLEPHRPGWGWDLAAPIVVEERDGTQVACTEVTIDGPSVLKYDRAGNIQVWLETTAAVTPTFIDDDP
jgi:hypothetical protein